MELSNLRMAEITHQVWYAALTKRIADFPMLLCKHSYNSLKDIDRLIEDIMQAKAELDYIKGNMDYYSKKVQQL
jgi:hypothetical protein